MSLVSHAPKGIYLLYFLVMLALHVITDRLAVISRQGCCSIIKVKQSFSTYGQSDDITRHDDEQKLGGSHSSRSQPVLNGVD